MITDDNQKDLVQDQFVSILKKISTFILFYFFVKLKENDYYQTVREQMSKTPYFVG